MCPLPTYYTRGPLSCPNRVCPVVYRGGEQLFMPVLVLTSGGLYLHATQDEYHTREMRFLLTKQYRLQHCVLYGNSIIQ